MKNIKNIFIASIFLGLTVLVLLFQNFVASPTESVVAGLSVGASTHLELEDKIISPVSAGTTIYLDCTSTNGNPNGNDTHSGERSDRAIATLNKAAEILRARGGTLLIKRGSICRGELHLTGARADISIDAYLDIKNPGAFLPIITGSEIVTGTPWIKQNIILENSTEIPRLRNKNIYSLDMSSFLANFKNKNNLSDIPQVKQLILEGDLKPLSNSVDTCNSNSFDTLVTRYGAASATAPVDHFVGGNNDFYLSEPISPDAGVFLRTGAWVWKKFKINRTDTSNKTVYFKIGAGNNFFEGSRNYFNGYRLVNSLSVMDCQNEWTYNSINKKIHFFNGGSSSISSNHNAEVTLRSHGIRFLFPASNTKNISIKNLRVKNTGSTAIYLENIPHIYVDNVYVENSNGSGISVKTANTVAVYNSDIRKTTHTGLRLASVSHKTHVERNILNSIGSLDNEAHGSFDLKGAILFSGAGEAMIRNNLIENIAYSAIELKPTHADTVIKVYNNSTKKTCLLSNDCAAIYMTGYNQNGFLGTTPGALGSKGIGLQDVLNVRAECSQSQPLPKTIFIHSNKIEDSLGYTKGISQWSLKQLGGGIYLDWSASDAIIYNNSLKNIYHARGAIHLHGGRNITVNANKVDQTKSGFPAMSIAQLWNEEARPVWMCHNLVVNNHFTGGSATQRLIQLRRNQYSSEGVVGDTRFSSLGIFHNNTLNQLNYPYFNTRMYQFVGGQDSNFSEGNNH